MEVALFFALAASVVTLHCQVFDISTGESQGEARAFTATVDYGREYVYLKGEPFGSGMGVGDLDVTPGAILVPHANLGDTGTLRGVRISRETGEVRIITYDLRTAISDASNQTGLEGERSYAGACRPGVLVPIPSAKF